MFSTKPPTFSCGGDGKAFLALVIAFILSLGFQLKHKATWRSGGCLTRHSHYVRVRLGGLTIASPKTSIKGSYGSILIKYFIKKTNITGYINTNTRILQTN